MKNKRIGKIYISSPLMDNMDISKMLKITSRFIVIRCEYLYHRDEFEYIAICPEFDEVENHTVMPTYLVKVKSEIIKDNEPAKIVDVEFIRQ